MDSPILKGLIEYNTKGSYPWHMPGHKRRLHTLFPDLIDNPFSIDVTEVDGLDEFHHPTGIIEESFKNAANIYGSDASFYLVNGSTCGILTAISSVCNHGDTIIVARNCHTSVYHAIRLLHLKPVYIVPQWDSGLNMFCSMEPDVIKKAVRENPTAKAVIVVSPTYEGVVSDIEKIAKIVHKRNIPLIVDEAHGAHFEYMSNVNETLSTVNHKKFPLPAIRLGADIVIESLHKTLPAMTQCAMIHIKSSLVSMEKIKEFLSIYQSSSPSYVFMATMEACIEKMDHERDGLFIVYKEVLSEYRKKFNNLKYISLVDTGKFKKGCVYGYDMGKLVFSVKNCGIRVNDRIEPFTGVQLGNILNEQYGQMVEMSAESYIIAMTSVADTKDAFEALYIALETIDNELIDIEEVADMYNESVINYARIPESKLGIGQAAECDKRTVNLFSSIGKMSGEYIYVYPPGIPILTPGELITKDIAGELIEAVKKGLNIKGIEYNRNFFGEKTNHIVLNDKAFREYAENIEVVVIQDYKWRTRKFMNRS
ncbi:MAG: aminotransferase class I/II-fold pyridoxal phosphate-dependent enzyme [Lachnospiraceae bacterium]